MDFSSALPTFVITLREGVEAALVVGIVLALLKKAQQTQLNSWVYAGVGAGLVASALVGVLLAGVTQTLVNSHSPYAPAMEPLLETLFGVIAIVLLSWMLIWMTQQARSMKTEVEGAVTAALTQDNRAGWGVFSLIFIAVVREGFETVLFIAAQFQQGFIPVAGAVAGLIVAVGVGFLLFKWGVKINIRQFFQVMGVLLLLIVAGLVISAFRHLDQAVATFVQLNPQSAGLCFYHDQFSQNPSCILGPMVWNTTKILPAKQFPGILLKTFFGYTDQLYIVQAVSYVAFLGIIGGLYFRSLTGSTAVQDNTTQKNLSSSQE